MNDRKRPKSKTGARTADRTNTSERPRAGKAAPRAGKAAVPARASKGAGAGATRKGARKAAPRFIKGEQFVSGERKSTGERRSAGERKPLGERRPTGERSGPGVRKSRRLAVDTRVPKGTRGGARHVARRQFKEEEAPVVRPAPRDDGDPRERRATTLGRVAKPAVRKRPDLSDDPHPGLYLLTTREGSEQDLIDELALLNVVDPPARKLAPSLVLAPKVPKRDKAPVELTFARQGFPIVQSVQAHDLDTIAQRIGRSLKGQLAKAREYALHVWVPDSDLGNPLASLADELETKLATLLEQTLPEAKRVDDTLLRRLGSIPFAQVCLIDPERAVAGVTYSNAAISLARGGRTRVRLTGDFPSRAARKVEEALAWLGLEPGAGDQCVDLGAAPGGWTYVLANRRAKVIAVDPAKLRPEILAKKGVVHIQQSAFSFQPDVTVDWLFSDMAWRPLEAAALLAKWGRRRWTRMLVANIKLPMTKKAEILTRVRAILEHEGDYKHVKMKQLYHDRDEITVTAHVK